MKQLIVGFLLVMFAFQVSACECSKYPLDSWESLKSYVVQNYGEELQDDESNMVWLKYYPTLYERLNAKDFIQTSCGEEGPNNEPMFHCSHREKNDYLIKFPKQNCEAKIQVLANYKKVKIKELSTTCKMK